jgi:iron(II)-dependent oxidoreductase
MKLASAGYSAAQALRSGGREIVREALLAARRRTLEQAEAYAAVLEPRGMRVPYNAGLNPPLWELGHIAWFQEYWIARNRQRSLGVACDPDHERTPSLIAQADARYDSSRIAHRSRWELELPDRAGTRALLDETLAQTLALLEALPAGASHDELYFFRLTALHEEMHAEAAAYMARSLGIALPIRAAATAEAAPTSTLRVPAQVFWMGAQEPGFAFDNELGANDVALEAFEIDAEPVSWAGYLRFIEAGGYEQARWWAPEGWSWLRQAGSRAQDLAAAATSGPALHLSEYEAQAWCRWAGRRLPSEAEWECAALTVPGFAWGRVWEWTASAFQPYPGFVAHPYRDYSAPWFGTRRVLRGACEATSLSLAHPRYRNFFEPQRCDIFAGFRSCA